MSGDKHQINLILKAKIRYVSLLFCAARNTENTAQLDCDDELEHTLSCGLVVSQAGQRKSNTVIQVQLILCSVQLSYIGHQVVHSSFLMKSSHANLKVFRPNIAVESHKSINSHCRQAVGG